MKNNTTPVLISRKASAYTEKIKARVEKAHSSMGLDPIDQVMEKLKELGAIYQKQFDRHVKRLEEIKADLSEISELTERLIEAKQHAEEALARVDKLSKLVA